MGPSHPKMMGEISLFPSSTNKHGYKNDNFLE